MVDEVCFFIYKPKHLEVPKMLNLEHIEKQEYLEDFEKSKKKIRILNQVGFETEKELFSIKRVEDFICLYFIKYQEKYNVKG